MGHEGPPKLRVLDGREDGVCGVRLLLVGEVDAGYDAFEQAAGEDGDHDVRRLLADMVFFSSGDGAGFDRHKRELAAYGPGTPEAGEAFVERQVLAVVFGVVVPAGAIRLPDLNQDRKSTRLNSSHANI